jgi:hypothetical protein
MARAAAARVSVRPSTRDPTLTLALVDAAGDPAISVVPERDVASVEAAEIHVYGRDETIAAVRARAKGPVVGHGAGMGVALVTRSAELSVAAESIAADVVPFDQRGCLSPRVALVEGEPGRASLLARLLDDCLGRWGERVPRGALAPDEVAGSVRWRDTMAFAGSVSTGAGHAVALGAAGMPLAIPPAGRHVLVLAIESAEEAFSRLAHVARFLVAIGSDDIARVAKVAPKHVRLSPLGRMQHPALDGPVDRR